MHRRRSQEGWHKKWRSWNKNQGEMGYEGSPVKAPPNTRRRMTPPMLQQISFSSTNGRQWQADLEEQRSIWSSPERKVIAAMDNYLEKSDDMKVEIAALELLMGQEEAEVCLGYILTQQDFRDLQHKREK